MDPAFRLVCHDYRMGLEIAKQRLGVASEIVLLDVWYSFLQYYMPPHRCAGQLTFDVCQFMDKGEELQRIDQ